MRFRHILSATLLLCVTLSRAQAPQTIPGDLLIMLKPGVDPQGIVDDMRIMDGGLSGLQTVELVSAPMRTWRYRFDHTRIGQDRMLGLVRTHHDVQLAQNNHHLTLRALPNDADFGQQWHHTNIDSQQAWDITTGGVTATGDTIVVCIVENANLPHADLIGNAWFNHQEIPNNNVDDDGNGYVDDFRGWDAGANDDDVYGGGHGTQVAGMIGAKGNNGIMVAGANWDVKMMVVANTGASDAGVLASHTYPLIMRRLYNDTDGEQGAFVVATNASWGIDGGQPEDAPIWCAMYDTLGTEGVLNCGATANNDVNIDVVGDLPTACPSDFMISVTATNNTDVRTFSGYGATTIDVGAPGANVITTNINGGIGSTSGTSFASPLTAGVIGLLYSAPCGSLMDLVHSDPQAGALYVREALFAGVEQVGNLPGNTVTGGRINSNNSLLYILNGCGACPEPYNLNATNTSLTEATLNWSSSTASAFNLHVEPVDGQGGPVLDVTDWNGTSYTLTDLQPCTPYQFTVSGICGPDTVSVWADTLIWTSEGCCVAPTTYTAIATDSTTATVEWTNVLAAQAFVLEYAIAGTGDWTTVNGVVGNSTELTGLQGCTSYELRLRSTCDGFNSSDWGPVLTFSTPGCGQCIDGDFCPSEADDATAEWIDRVRIGTIDNESGTNGGYAFFTDQTATLLTGQTYPIILTPGFDGFTFQEYWGVWIDLDGDGQFESPSERMFGTTNGSTIEINGTVAIPADAPLGATRMRVIMRFNTAASNGCQDGYDYGETEDYCVNIEQSSGVVSVASPLVASVFPNPADREAMISLPVDFTKGVLEVLDPTGRIITVVNATSGANTVATSTWPAGPYTYRVMQGGSVRYRGNFSVVH